MVLGELCNFAAYTFAPAILVTPLGALGVLISALLASIFLDEKLGRDGIIGCGLALIGSLVIILHAPAEKNVSSINEILRLALAPGFVLYSLIVIGATLYLVYEASPRYGKTNPLVYISICSLVGSMTVVACKACGIALRLTFEGDNQFTHLSTYFFIAVTFFCIAVQMNYFNKALDIFSTSIVTPIYNVLFTTATIAASVIMMQGIYDATTPDIITIFCGFITTFIGVFLLNTPKAHPGLRRNSSIGGSMLPTDSIIGKTLLHNFDQDNLGFNGLDDSIEDYQ